MRILFIGEYSRLHNSLKEALTKMGHEVVIVGNGDGFKNLPVDFNINAKFSKSKIPNLFRQAIFRIFKYDVAEWEYGLRFQALLPKLQGFDVVQLISETPLFTFLPFEFQLLKKLGKQNHKMFMLTSGTDAIFMQAAIDKKFRYSLLDPYLTDKNLIAEYRHALPHLEPKYKKHHKKMLGLVNGIIASDIDYAIALEGELKSLGLIANPVNTDKIAFKSLEISGPIVIFHGINRWNYHKKGNVFFEKALKIIGEKYGEKVKIISSENIPYDDYIKLYNASHILLDQVYAYDQGYNALEAMAKGKVVFTGAEKEFNDYYGLTQRVAVNALPDVDSIVNELSFLIENPLEISAIGNRARAFIEKEHDYMKVAEQYLKTWQEN
jgi:glycosyltransferase involved in cell wall biosynthesis